VGIGAIHANFEGSTGRVGKYLAWRDSRNEGSEGSSSGTEGAVGKWVAGCGRSVGRVDGFETGCRWIGSAGSLSSSNVTVLAGVIRLPDGLVLV
jgi:hypothetical protein